MDKPGGHYAMENKPDRQRQILHDSTYMLNQKKKTAELIETEWWLSRADRWGKYGETGKRVQTLSCKMNNF